MFKEMRIICLKKKGKEFKIGCVVLIVIFLKIISKIYLLSKIMFIRFIWFCR